MSAEQNSSYKEKLRIYVENARKQGFSDAQLREKFVATKVSQDIIDELLPGEKENPAKEGSEKAQESKKDSKEYSRDDDVFTPEEFEELEKKETKGLGGLFKRKEEKTEDQKVAEDDYIEFNAKQISKEIAHLQKQIENEEVTEGKLEGKIDILTTKTKDITEELETFGEKVGELRSTVLGRERMFNKLEDDFNSVKYIVNTFKPEAIDKRFSDVQAEALKHESKIEKIEVRLKAIEDKLKEYSEIMKSIRSYESVLAKLESLQKEEKVIEKLKMDIDKTGSKIEVMFHNVEESIAKINETGIIAENNQSSIRELMIALSKLETQTDFFVKKEDYNQLKSDIQVIKKVIYDKELQKG